MYIYEDIPMLVELIQKHQDEHINLLVDENVLNSELIATKLFYAHHSIVIDIRSIFKTIRFLKDYHKYDRNIDDIYKMVGVVSERLYMDNQDAIDILESYFNMYLIRAYSSIINKDNITMRDLLDLYNIDVITIKNPSNDGQPLKNK